MTVASEKPSLCDMCGHIHLNVIKHRITECSATYDKKRLFLSGIYTNISHEVYTELVLATSETCLMMILDASPTSVTPDSEYNLFTREAILFAYKCFNGPF